MTVMIKVAAPKQLLSDQRGNSIISNNWVTRRRRRRREFGAYDVGGRADGRGRPPAGGRVQYTMLHCSLGNLGDFTSFFTHAAPPLALPLHLISPILGRSVGRRSVCPESRPSSFLRCRLLFCAPSRSSRIVPRRRNAATRARATFSQVTSSERAREGVSES